jgi:hypothetical protein
MWLASEQAFSVLHKAWKDAHVLVVQKLSLCDCAMVLQDWLSVRAIKKQLYYTIFGIKGLQ